ncbi:MAG: hypothetical protein K1W24_07580 [Lachnospiraceae bacterium]
MHNKKAIKVPTINIGGIGSNMPEIKLPATKKPPAIKNGTRQYLTIAAEDNII